MPNSTHTRDRFVGTVVSWNNKGYYEVYYPEPSCDKNCSLTESYTKTQDYASKCLKCLKSMCENFTKKLSENLYLVTYIISESSVDANFRRTFMFNLPMLIHMLSHVSVSIDGVRIGNWLF
jgi:hypothetical protein